MALWRVRATVDDRPGYLSVLTASLALRSVNILAVQVHTTEAGAVDDFLVDAPDTMTEADLLGAVTRGRGRDAFVSRAEAQGLADQPTRALALAGRLVHDADALGEALIALLDAAEVRWRAEPVAGPGFTDTRMQLADPAGGSFEVVRAAPAFTPAEYARAQALMEVSGALLRRDAEQATLLLPDGAELLIRPVLADDADGLRRLHGGRLSDARLRRLLEPSAGLTLVALHLDPGSAEEQVVAVGHLLAEGDLGEVAVLVEHAWQRRGIGTALLRRLTGYARRGGFAALAAHTASDDVAMLGTLRRLGFDGADPDGPMVTLTLAMHARRRRAGHETPATFG